MTLTHESDALQIRLAEEEQALGRLEQVMNLVDRFEAGDKEGDPALCLQEYTKIFQQLQTEFYQEYKTLGLGDLAVSVVQPLLKERLRSWDPLKVYIFILYVFILPYKCLGSARFFNVFESPLCSQRLPNN